MASMLRCRLLCSSWTAGSSVAQTGSVRGRNANGWATACPSAASRPGSSWQRLRMLRGAIATALHMATGRIPPADGLKISFLTKESPMNGRF